MSTHNFPAFCVEIHEGQISLSGNMGMLNKSFDSDIMTALEREASLQGIAAGASGVIEGVTSFLQKRPPEFKGK